MKTKEPIESESMDQTIVRRSGVGPNDLIAGWQSVLSRMLDQMQPFMQPARIITFQHIQPHEQPTNFTRDDCQWPTRPPAIRTCCGCV